MVKRIEISRERLFLPGYKQRLRVVAISDFHAPRFYRSASDLIHLINVESPDLFILAGDVIDKIGNESLVGIFGKVKAKFAKLAALGNWEYHSELDVVKLRSEYERAGISLLINTAVETAGLTIVGLDDLVGGAPDFEIFHRIPQSPNPVLVISNCPASFDVISSRSRSPLIVLSGHTHGGQIAPLGMVLVTPPGSGTYVQGWYRRGQHVM